MHARQTARAACLPLLAAALSGCLSGPIDEDPNDDLYVDPSGKQMLFTGFTYDPEALYIETQVCGTGCAHASSIVASNPLFQKSVVTGASVSLLDASTGQATMGASELTDAEGLWRAPNIPQVLEPALYVGSAGGGALMSAESGVVASDYVPSVNLRPVVRNFPSCLSLPTMPVAKQGVLSAVAAHLTRVTGTATSVDDLLDPTKFGGVVVWWLLVPGSPLENSSAIGTSIRADGEAAIMNLAWAKPGTGPAGQSARGFYVDADSPTSPIGVTAIVLPVERSGQPVTFTVNDPVNDPSLGRPYNYPPITVAPVPGHANIARLGLSFSAPEGQQPPVSSVPGMPVWQCVRSSESGY